VEIGAATANEPTLVSPRTTELAIAHSRITPQHARTIQSTNRRYPVMSMLLRITLVHFASLILISTPILAAETDPPSAPAGRPRIALVMGGGGSHAIAHLGVLKELERQHVPIDLIVGNGLGGLIGGLYASGMSIDEIHALLTETDWVEIFNPDTKREDLSFRRKQDDDDFLIKYKVGIKDGQAQLPTSLIPNAKLGWLLQKVTANTKGLASFDDLPIPYRAITMDMVSGELVALDAGALDRALLATLAAPGTLPPVEIDGRLLVTGSPSTSGCSRDRPRT